jgi:hypothetical protein
MALQVHLVDDIVAMPTELFEGAECNALVHNFFLVERFFLVKGHETAPMIDA